MAAAMVFVYKSDDARAVRVDISIKPLLVEQLL